MAADYKSTVFLPRTDFPMRGSLPEREPEILARWEKLGLYQRQREAAKGKRKFIGNMMLVLCTTLIAMTGNMTPQTAGVLSVVALSFNGANAAEHKFSNGK